MDKPDNRRKFLRDTLALRGIVPVAETRSLAAASHKPEKGGGQ